MFSIPAKIALPVRLLLFSLILMVFAASHAIAETEPKKPTGNMTIYWENDFFAGSDRDYTNGIKIIWGSGYTPKGDPSELPAWSRKPVQWLPLIGSTDQQLGTSLAIAQEMYTPQDRKSTALVVDERPYAGWLALSTGLYGRTDRQQTSYLLTVGLLGPISMAEQTQELIHSFFDGQVAEGWDNQLENELTLDASLQSRWRFLPVGRRQGMGLELIPHAGARLGTAKTYAEVGAEARFGWRMADDFGSCQMRDDCIPDQNYDKKAPFGMHLFTRINGRAVLRNIFLDGNTFRASHSVDKEPFVADVTAGFGVQYRSFRMIYAYVYLSKEYKIQTYKHKFGTLYFSWEF